MIAALTVMAIINNTYSFMIALLITTMITIAILVYKKNKK